MKNIEKNDLLEETLSQLDELAQLDEFKDTKKQGYDDREDESDGEKHGKESDHKQSEKDRRDDTDGKFGKRDKEDRKPSLEENLRTLDLLAEVGVEASEQPTQPLSQHDDDNLTTEGAEDASADSLDGSIEPVTETQTEDQREFAVAESKKGYTYDMKGADLVVTSPEGKTKVIKDFTYFDEKPSQAELKASKIKKGKKDDQRC